MFTLLTEILVGGVTLSIPNGAEFAAFTSFAAFTTCLTFVWFPSVNRVKRSVLYHFYRSFSFYRSFRLERLVSIVRFVWNV